MTWPSWCVNHVAMKTIRVVLVVALLTLVLSEAAEAQTDPSISVDGLTITVEGVDGARWWVGEEKPAKKGWDEQDRFCPCEFSAPPGTEQVTVRWLIREPRQTKVVVIDLDSLPPPGECDPAHPSVLDRPPVSLPANGIVIGHSNGHRFGGEVVDANPGWVNSSRGGHDASDWVDNKNGVYDAAIAANPDARAVVTVLSERITDPGGPYPPEPSLDLYESSMRTLIDRLYRDLPELETVILRSRMTGRHSEKLFNMNGEPWTFQHNEIMRDLADEIDGVEFVNVWDAEGAECRQYLERDDFASDGVHPMGSGAAKVYDVFEQQVVRL